VEEIMRVLLSLTALAALSCSAAEPNAPIADSDESSKNAESARIETAGQPDKANTVVDQDGITISGGSLVSRTAGRFDNAPPQADEFFTRKPAGAAYSPGQEVVVKEEKAEFLPQRVIELNAARKAMMGGGR
jgi:hypothetical protein